jgi:hypothetical protein
MSLLIRSGKVIGKSILVLAVMSIPVFARQEHKSEPKPPAHHESRPNHLSHPSHPNQSHKATPSHAAHPSQSPHASHPSSASHASHASHPSVAKRVPVPSHTPAASHESGAVRENKPVEEHTAGSRPEGNVGNHEGGNSGRPGEAEVNRGGNIPENRGETGNRAERTVALKGGGSATIRPNGQLRSIDRNGMQIHSNLHGERTIVSEHNNVRIVNVGHGGYVQHAYMTRGGHSYYSRTYYEHGVYRTAVYRSYYYHGFHYYGYHPAFWFHPGFYGWAYHPWGVGISWGVGFGGWGWAGAPWFGFYGGFFAPYPVYPSPAFWLTDYLIAADLQAEYAARAEARAEANAEANAAANAAANAVANDAAAAAYGPGAASNPSADSSGPPANSATVTLSPEVKEAIAEEVKAQLAEQQQQAAAESAGNAQTQAPAPAPAGGEVSPAQTPSAQDEVPPALDPAKRTFVVDNDITATLDGQECELTGGDVITRLTDTPDADNKVTASVSASKKTDCAAGKSVLVSVDDLQEMHNHFEEQLENGMKALAQKQGTGDMPKAPDTGMTESNIPAPKPDTTAAKDLADQAAAADQTETQVKQETAAADGQEGKQ